MEQVISGATESSWNSPSNNVHDQIRTNAQHISVDFTLTISRAISDWITCDIYTFLFIIILDLLE